MVFAISFATCVKISLSIFKSILEPYTLLFWFPMNLTFTNDLIYNFTVAVPEARRRSSAVSRERLRQRERAFSDPIGIPGSSGSDTAARKSMPDASNRLTKSVLHVIDEDKVVKEPQEPTIDDIKKMLVKRPSVRKLILFFCFILFLTSLRT